MRRPNPAIISSLRICIVVCLCNPIFKYDYSIFVIVLMWSIGDLVHSSILSQRRKPLSEVYLIVTKMIGVEKGLTIIISRCYLFARGEFHVGPRWFGLLRGSMSRDISWFRRDSCTSNQHRVSSQLDLFDGKISIRVGNNESSSFSSSSF